jgi:NAD(P)H-hydrate epimerase
MNSIKLITGEKVSFKPSADIIIDGILGTGISGTIREPYASAIKVINDSSAFKLAVDVPSGLDPDTGNTSNIYVKADITVTFHKMKVGMSKRKDVCGQIFVEKIGIPPEAEEGVL